MDFFSGLNRWQGDVVDSESRLSPSKFWYGSPAFAPSGFAILSLHPRFRRPLKRGSIREGYSRLHGEWAQQGEIRNQKKMEGRKNIPHEEVFRGCTIIGIFFDSCVA